MWGSYEQRIQTLCLLLSAILVYLARQVRDHHGASNAITAMTTGCEFARPGTYVPRPSGISAKWCNTTSETPALINHMRVHCKKMDACIAAEFGSMVAIGYMVDLDLFLINPEPEPADAVMITCVFDNNPLLEVAKRSPVVVKYIDEKTLLQTSRSFHNRWACVAHAIMDAMNGRET